MIKLVLATIAMLAPAGVMAWPSTGVPDPYGAKSIVRNDFSTLQPRLAAAVTKGDRTPEVLLNLAAIYSKQNDAMRADALYRMVLDQPNIDLATLSGNAWSHDLATRGLERTRTIAAR